MICNSPLWGMDSLIRSRVLAVADETKSPVESGVCTWIDVWNWERDTDLSSTHSAGSYLIERGETTWRTIKRKP